MSKPQKSMNDAGTRAEPRPLAQQEGEDPGRNLDQQLDAELEQTFPASDALTITRDRH